MADKIKRLILGQLPIQACNLRCPYCYISQREGWERDDHRFRYSPEHMANCLSVDRLGGISLINLTAQGETLLYKDLPELTERILEQGHYVEIVTNGTVGNRIDEILSIPEELLARLEFKISYHYSELKRKGLFDSFTENVKKIASSPASFTLELMPFDGLNDEIDVIVEETQNTFGALCHATVGRNESIRTYPLLTDLPEDEYRAVWDRLDSKMFDFKMGLYGVKRKEFCYAGAWSLFVDFATGEARQCYKFPNNQNIFKNPQAPIKFIPVGYHCPDNYCYNGHSHMAFGVIPEYDESTYYEIRNRSTESGENWIKEPCKSFFSSKFSDSNMEYSVSQKRKNSFLFPLRYGRMLARAGFRRIREKIGVK